MEETEGIEKYFAISPEGDFVIEFEVEEFKLQAYTIESDNDSRIKKKAIWSIYVSEKSTGSLEFGAVSDKSTSSSEFRLLVLPCIGHRNMVHYKDNSSTVDPEEIPKNGHTSLLIINNVNNNYLVSFIDGKELPIEYGGIVKLFSKKDHITNQKAEKDKKTI
ncbi:5008_t:CDS:2 [Racocetra persica]|uniref:5008_t:CDS:1 n=1 Tax=Racocetra persica TaxID=160502 RepID=A0ACA9PDE7_9GLOM|nr:5008_t:CDS:2 [Racocetra persica]